MLKSSFIFNIFNQHAVPKEMGYHTGLLYRSEGLWMSCVWGGVGELENATIPSHRFELCLFKEYLPEI